VITSRLTHGRPIGHKIQSQDGKTSKIIDALNNILHTSGNNIIHQAEQQIAHIAQGTLTTSSVSGVINQVASHFNFGAAGGSVSTFDSSDPLPPIPVPSTQTIMNVIGSILASGVIGAAGGMAGAGSPSGAPAGSTPPPGSVGEVIQSIVTTAVNLPINTAVNITSISLSPGDWDVYGDIWFTLGSAGATIIVACLNINSATLPGAPNPAIARTQFNLTMPASQSEFVPIRPCRANLTAQTTYYLIAQANTTVACTAVGTIWARRAR
jgi:hypothetical protein